MRLKQFLQEKLNLPHGELVWVSPDKFGKTVVDNKRLRTEIDNLKSQIKTNKWVVPISATPKGFIVDGFHRLVALKEMGFKKIPVWVGEQKGAAGILKNPYPGLSIKLREFPK